MANQYNHNTQPLLKVGDRIGQLRVIKYRGYYKSEKSKSLAKWNTHYYDAKCSCGAVVHEINQAKLRGKRPRTSCDRCAHLTRVKTRHESLPKKHERFFHPEWPVLPCDLERTRGVGR